MWFLRRTRIFYALRSIIKLELIMSDKIEVFRYPIQYRTIAIVAPLMIVFASLGLTFVSWSNLNTNGWINEAGQVINPTTFWIAAIGGVILATFFALCIHLTYPTINKTQNGFQIETYIYTSPWFTWDDIVTVSLPPSRMVTQIYSIGVKELHPLFWAIGLSRGMFAPGFLIHPRMINGGKLLRAMIKARPELFEQ